MKTNRFLIGFSLAVLTISAAIVFIWLPERTMIMGHDSGYRLFIPEFFRSLFSSWITTINFGGGGLYNPGVIPIHLPEYIFSVVLREPVFVQRAVLIWWHVLNLSSVFLAYLFVFRDRSARRLITSAVASILYGINFYNLHAWSVLWRTKFSTQFVLPFLIFFLYETFRVSRIEWKKVVLLSVILVLFNGGGSPPLYGPLMVAWAAVGLYGIVISKSRKNATLLFLKLTLGLGFMFSILSAYWLIPYVVHAVKSYTVQLQAQGGLGSIEVIVDAVSKNASFLNIMRLQGLPAWDNESPFPFMRTYVNHPVLIILSFVWIVLVIVALLAAGKKEERRFVGMALILFLVGSFFTAGSHGPTGWLFQWLVYFVPGFAIFRTAFYKFGMIPLFAVSLLVSHSVGFLTEAAENRIGNRTYRSCILAGFVVFVFLYHLPFIRGIFFDYNMPFTNKVTIPGYVFDAAEYIHRNTKPESKVLLLPRLYGDRMDGYTWGYWGPDPLPHMVIDRAIVSDAYGPPTVVDAMYRALYEKRLDDFAVLLTVSGIDTILWRTDILYTDKVTRGEDFQILEEDLKNVAGVRLTASFDAWRVYSVDASRVWPLFYAPRQSIRTDMQYGDLVDAVSLTKTFPHTLPALVSPSTNSLPGSSGIFLRAYCIWCDPKDRDRLETTADFVPVMLLPNSKFYFLVRAKENALVRSKRISPRARARTYYSLIRVRISEIKRYIDMNRQDVYAYIEKNVDSISAYLTEAGNAVTALPLREKHEISAELITLLKGYIFVVNTLHGEGKIEQGIRDLKLLMERELDKLESETWYTKDPGRLAYFLDVNESATYAVTVRSEVPRALTRIMDGQQFDTDTIYLEKGTHTLEVIESDVGKIRIRPEKVGIRDFIASVSGGNDYELRFSYESVGDSPAVLEVIPEYDADVKDRTRATKWALASNIGEQAFRKTIKTDTKTARLRFRFTPETQEGSVSVTNLVLTRIDIPSVYLTKEENASFSVVPTIDYYPYGRTRYGVSVKGATDRFVLHFGQLFDPSWQAYFIDPTSRKRERLRDEAHVKTNGFTNGWLVDRTGDFKMIIEYDPQRFVAIGFLVTAAGILASLAVIVKRSV